MINFKQYFEMASFTLPYSIEINGVYVDAIDMQFEISPPTKNKNGKTMNQGSKFIAKIPDKDKYIAYDGKGSATFVKQKDMPQLAMDNYEKIPEDWWVKARLLSPMTKAI